MELLLVGRWPPLKPLPIFKYESHGHRASIDFDKIRGEWVCRKTSLQFNKIQEVRGGLTEIMLGLPRSQAKMLADDAVAEQQEQELENDATRRRQAMSDWRENYENGALYKGLRDFLSSGEQTEIEESIRLTLTARQLQCSAKNISYVFDALSRAGGKLATLIEIAQRNKTEQRTSVPAHEEWEVAVLDTEDPASVESIPQRGDRRLHPRIAPALPGYVEFDGTKAGVVLNIGETGMAVDLAGPLQVDKDPQSFRLQMPGVGASIEISAQIVWLAETKKGAGLRFVDLTAEARNQISTWLLSENSAPASRDLTSTHVESAIPVTSDVVPEEPIRSVLPLQDDPSPLEWSLPKLSESTELVTPEILDADLPLVGEVLRDKIRHPAAVSELRSRGRRLKVESPAGHGENSPARKHTLEISGLQIAEFALIFFLAVIALTVGLTVGRGPLGRRLYGTQKSMSTSDATTPAPSNGPGETASRNYTSPSAITDLAPDKSSIANQLNPATPPEEKQIESAANSESNAKVPSTIANLSPPTETKPAVNADANSVSNGPAGLPVRQPAEPKVSHLPHVVDSKRDRPGNPAPAKLTPAMEAAPHALPPSTILVAIPGRGGKPFRITFPEKPIAASSSIAMTSQLSILVSPQLGPALAHRSARLQGGELAYFVWPHYSRAGDSYGNAETVKVRATIGELGQVLEVKLISGSVSLLPDTLSSVRLWRYKPTLLNKRPVKAQEDITIEFRPPQYLSQVHTQHSANK
jgi:hypothetical protein